MTQRESSSIKIICSDDYFEDLYESVDYNGQISAVLPSNLLNGRVKGRDISVSFPVDEAVRLRYLPHLEDQIATVLTQTGKEVQSRRPHADRRPVDETFDLALIDLLERSLRTEGVSIERSSVGKPKILALSLHEAWKMNSWPKIQRHLEKSNVVAREIGLESVPDQSTFNRSSKECQYYPETVGAAATRAVHAAFRNGISLPPSVADEYCLARSSPARSNQSRVPEKLKRRALLNWVDLILDEILSDVSMGRAENCQFTVKQLFGALAIASTCPSLNALKRFSGWEYDSDEIPTAEHIGGLIRSLPLKKIRSIFKVITDSFIHFGSRLGFFDEPYTYAIDKTWIDAGQDISDEGDSASVIENPQQCESGSGWCFAALHVVNRDARFTLGLDLITSKDESSNQFHSLLYNVGQSTGVKRILADREFYEGDAVRACRTVSGKNWIIRVKNKNEGDVSEHLDSAPAGENAYARNVDFSTVSPNPNLYIYHVPDSAQKWAGGTHTGFITDLSPEETDIETVFHIYRRRWSIENYFNQIKNDFGISTQTRSPKIRLFLLIVQTVFFNIHTLINRAISPQLALPLDVTYDDVLNAIKCSIFTQTPPCEYY